MMGRFGQKKQRAGTFAQRLGADPGPPVTPGTHTRKQYLIAVIALVVLTLALTREPKRESIIAEDIDTSKISETEIRADFYFESVDILATKEARDAAMAKVPSYYGVEREQEQNQLRLLRKRIELVNAERENVSKAVLEALYASTSDQTVESIVSVTVAGSVNKLKENPEWAALPEAPALALWLTPDLHSLPQRQFAPPPVKHGKAQVAEAPQTVTSLSPAEPVRLVFTYGDRLNDIAVESLEYVLSQGVRNPAEQAEPSRRVVILRDAPVLDQQVSSEIQWADVPGPEEAEEILSERLLDMAKQAAQDTEEPAGWAKLHDAAFAMARACLSPTLRYDAVYTAGARERARESVQPVLRKIEAGEIIQDRGRRWTEQSRSDVKTYLELLQSEKKPSQRVFSMAVSNMIIIMLALFCLYRSAALTPGMEPEELTLQTNLALLLMCAMLIAGRIVSYFEPSGFILPVAAAGILFAILVNVRIAAMMSFLTAALVSVQYGYDWRLMVVGSAMSLAGVLSIFKVRRRSDMAGASLKAMAVGLLAITAVSLASDSLLNEAVVRRLSLIGLNGFLCLLIVPGLLSPLERLFKLTTDIQLLEYSDLNNEVMSQLAMKAPATYAHSLMLGQLAEAAADAIGANGLLARVCAYYHDIGKMLRSEYYSENQNGYNIHDELSPRMSARAIAAHVVQGAEMAREFHLPKPIIDGICEHHGTCRIGFFYQQALDQQKHGDVREEDFRYPGPKPQRPETAILMICDAVESGVRSIKNANQERVREFVDKIISARAADRQFDDCNLTLKQLDTIAEVVSRRIMSNLHTRLAYPEPAPEKVTNVIAMPGGVE
ncbi:MAG TPA: HDIG domain-containing protein [Candidatus Hydrogenedentes bacterium]|nr:HDIG domain-containing protein [Candidatus Hydrogenedentota bacterium]